MNQIVKIKHDNNNNNKVVRVVQEMVSNYLLRLIADWHHLARSIRKMYSTDKY